METRVETRATTRVLAKYSRTLGSWKRPWYHFRVKPVKWTPLRLSLKERATMTRMGR